MRNLKDKEAFITGIGILSPIGNDCESVLNSLRQGKDGIADATKIDTSFYASHLCAEVKDFDASVNMDSSELEIYTDPFLRFAISSARRALIDSGLDLQKYDGKVGLVFATCNAGLNSREKEYAVKYGVENGNFTLSDSIQSEFYAAGMALSSALKLKGEFWIVNTACSGSTAAIGLAESLIESGDCDLVLVGGADAVALSNYAGFCAIKVVSSQKIAPFSTPEGMNIGEGAAFWILESSSSARLRGSKVYGKVIGFATGADAHHPTQPDPRGEGAYKVMRKAVENAGVDVSQIACINAHGSGTSANDKAESKGIAKFLNGTSIPVTSTKSYMGHCMGATGILEATCQLLSMNDNFIPATLRNVGVRAGCQVEALATSKEGAYDCFLSANYAFAGNNSAIVITKENFESKKIFDNPKKRVVISGLGVVSGLGVNVESNLEALKCGRSALSESLRLNEYIAGLVELPSPRTLDRRIDFSGMNHISTIATLAAKSSMDSAGFKMTRSMSDRVGLVVGVSRGADESAHNNAVYGTPERRGDVGCFSNITANSTAGWVSKALELKGSNITLTSGADCALQALEFARRQIEDESADVMIAMGADELYAQELDGYHSVGKIYSTQEFDKFKMCSDDSLKTVLGEGASAVFMESMESAKSRGVEYFAELLSVGMVQSSKKFLECDFDGDALIEAIELALDKSEVKTSEIGLVVFSPYGNAQDKKILEICKKLFPEVPMLTSVFNTGKIESSSALHGLICSLACIKNGMGYWNSKTGIDEIDNVLMEKAPDKILCISSGNIGNNYAAVFGL